MNFSPAHEALSSMNGMQWLLMMYFEAYWPEGTDSNPAYTSGGESWKNVVDQGLCHQLREMSW